MTSEHRPGQDLSADPPSQQKTTKSRPISELTAAEVLAHRDSALGQMRFAREYTLQLIADVPVEIWYDMPTGAPTHLAWQIGHLAVSEYGLMLFRQRGRAEGDLELMPGWLRKKFGRGTKPISGADGQPAPEELLAVLEKIHRQSLEEAASLSVETLVTESEMPYAVFPAKLGALLFAPIHESLHAGQIGLVRRLLGSDPIR